MVELEPGVVEDHDSLASFNNELEQSIGQILGKLVTMTRLLCPQRAENRTLNSPAN